MSPLTTLRDPAPSSRATEQLVRSGLLGDRGLRGALGISTLGSCMEPTIRDGERLTVEARRPLPGDVVVFFDHHQRLVAHRLLGWRLSRQPPAGRLRLIWATAADRGTALDRPVDRDRQVGVVTRVSGVAYRPSFARRLLSGGRFLGFAARALTVRCFGRRPDPEITTNIRPKG